MGKNLRAHTQQPEVYLKEVLADIATLNRRGPYAGMYNLQDSYKQRSATKAEAAAGQGSSADHDGGEQKEGVKKGEEDVKPDLPDELLDDEDDDDIDMDAIA